MIAVAPIATADLAPLRELFLDLSDHETDVARLAANFSRVADDPGYILLGAKLDGQLVGFMMGIICLDFVGSCRPFMVVENVVVSRAARRQGVARQLWAALEAEARQQDCYYVILVSGDWREEAHKFYTSVGFAADRFKGFKKYLE